MGRAARHVAGVLLVTGAIDDDEAALLSVEIAPSNIDGNALFTLSGEAIDEQAKIGQARCASKARTFDSGALVIIQIGGVK